MKEYIQIILGLCFLLRPIAIKADITIKGRIWQPAKERIWYSVSYYTDALNFQTETTSERLVYHAVDEDYAKFSVTLPMTEKRFVQIRYDHTETPYKEAGSSVSFNPWAYREHEVFLPAEGEVTIDLYPDGRAVVAGAFEEENAFLNDFKQAFAKADPPDYTTLKTDYDEVYARHTPESYKAFAKSLAKKKTTMLQMANDKSAFDAYFFKALKLRWQNEYISRILYYPRYHDSPREDRGLKPFEIDKAAYFADLDIDLSQDADSFLGMDSHYYGMLMNFRSFLFLNQLMPEYKDTSLEEKYQWVSQNVPNLRTRQWLHWEVIDLMIEGEKKKENPQKPSLLATYFEEHPNEELEKGVNSYFGRLNAIQPGKPAPDFEVIDLDGNTVRLSDFKGQVVYIDFWATWCKPCIEEIPASKALQEHFAKDNVVFLYLSADYEEEELRAMVDKKQLQGIHAHVRDIDNSPLKTYMVSEYPTYMLIGKDGQIINHQASRPSNPATEDLIRKALEE